MRSLKQQVREAYNKTKAVHLKTVEDQSVDPSTALGKFLSMNKGDVLPKPPNDSAEIGVVVDRMASATESEIRFGISIDRSKAHYTHWSEEVERFTGRAYSVEWFDRIGTAINGLVLDQKLKFNRTRPYQMGVNALVPDVGTPSYPSGHAADAWTFALVLGRKHPHLSEHFNSMAERVSDSRVVVGVHFPSDLWAGKMLAHHIMDHQLIDD